MEEASERFSGRGHGEQSTRYERFEGVRVTWGECASAERQTEREAKQKQDRRHVSGKDAVMKERKWAKR